jgi:hypothetical protein
MIVIELVWTVRDKWQLLCIHCNLNCAHWVVMVQDYEIKVNKMSIRSGEESPPLQIGGNEETVEFAIYVSAAEHRPVVYSLSVYRGEMFHPFATTLCFNVENLMHPYIWGSLTCTIIQL